MTIAIRVALSAGLALSVACGDNTAACGEGTVEEGGQCVAVVVPPVTCREGTQYDELTNACVVAPSACLDGTVLVHGQCQDPTDALEPDLEESVEPNGAGVLGEASVAPAGVLTLRASGAPGVILHGTIVPQPDRDEDGVPEPDVDTFIVDATAPAVLEITADGVGGLAGGFIVLGDAPGLEAWARIGVNLTGDTARRRLFLPVAGRYRIGITDARTLALPGAVVGGDTAEYFVTIAQHPLTSPVSIALTGGMGAVGGMLDPLDVKFYTAMLGTGRNNLSLATTHEGTVGSLVVLASGALAGVDEPTPGPAALEVTGLEPGEPVTIVVDHRITGTTTPVPFVLDVTAR